MNSTQVSTINNESIMIPATATVTNVSYPGTTAIRILFDSGWSLSVVMGKASFGGKSGLFEICPFDRMDRPGAYIFEGISGPGEWSDDVLGHLTADEVNYWINKMENLPF